MTLVMSFVTAEKKTKTNQNETRKENKYEKNRERGKTRQKKDKLNIEKVRRTLSSLVVFF